MAKGKSDPQQVESGTPDIERLQRIRRAASDLVNELFTSDFPQEPRDLWNLSPSPLKELVELLLNREFSRHWFDAKDKRVADNLDRVWENHRRAETAAVP